MVLSWWSLIRYKWHGYSFHVPDFEMYSDPQLPVTVNGRIEHRDCNYRFCQEGGLWLYLFCGEWKLLWRELISHRACGWVWYPFLTLQQITMEVNMRLSRHKCYRCNKRFWTWGTGWQMCWKCQKREAAMLDEPPF